MEVATESLLVFLFFFLGGVVVDMMFGSNCKRCRLEVGRWGVVYLFKSVFGKLLVPEDGTMRLV